MKGKALMAAASIACVFSCALGFAACDLFGGGDEGEEGNKQYAVFHFNGGYRGSDHNDTEDYRYYLYEGDTFTPLKAKKDTWVLENWYFDEGLTEAYSDARFEELRAQKDEIDLYAKWIDEVTVTKDNFTEFFSVSSRWNGGLNAGSSGNAGIYYSISPKMTFDPATSAESFEVEVTPVLTDLRDEVVWSSETTTVTLTSEADYSCSYLRKIDSSAVGVQFNIAGRTLEYELLTESFQVKLLHKVPVEITLDLGGGETDTLNATGSEKLLKSDLPTPEKDGYVFKGWYTDAEFKTEYEEWVVNRPRTLYAKFAKQVTVTYHMNGAADKESETYLEGEYIYLGSDSTPERRGYKFFGYYTTENFADGTKFTSGQVGEENIDLYARWEAIRTITFEMNGAAAKAPIEIADTEIPDLGDTPFKNYSVDFHGWYTNEECTQPFDDEAPISGDVTLYALWVKTVNLSMLSVEDLKEYLDIQLENQNVDGDLTLNLTVTVKEKYRGYDFVLNGQWGVDLTNESNQNLGSIYFESTGGMRLSTRDNKITATGTYTLQSNATVFKLKINAQWGEVYIPESDLEEE